MLNLKDKYEDFNILFITNTSSRKMQQIELCHNGSAYFCVNQKWKGVLILGDLEIVEDNELKAQIWEPDWKVYYPQGIEDPDYSILKLNGKKGIIYSDFQKIPFDVVSLNFQLSKTNNFKKIFLCHLNRS